MGGVGLIANMRAVAAARVAVAALGWTGTVIVARHLDVIDWGRFTFVFTLLGIISIFTGFGLGRVALSGLIEGAPDVDRFAGTYIVLRAVMGIGGYLIAVGFVLAAGYDRHVVAATAVAGLVQVIATPSHAVEGIYQARMRMPVVAVASVLGQTAQLALTVAITLWRPTLLLLVIPAVLNEIVAIGWKYARVGVLARPILHVDWQRWRLMLGEAVPLGVGAGLATLYYSVDTLILSKLDTFTSVGIYGIGVRFADLVTSGGTLMLVPATALLVRAWDTDAHRFQAVAGRVFGIFMIVTAVIGMEITVFAAPLLRMLFGDRYVVGAGAARLVVLSACLGLFGLLAYNMQVAAGRLRIYPVMAGIGLVVDVALTVALVPSLSYRGAAIASAVTEILVTTGLWWAARPLGGFTLEPLRRVPLVVIAATVAGALGWGIESVAPWPVGALAAAAALVGAVQLLRLVGPGGLRGLLTDDETTLSQSTTPVDVPVAVAAPLAG